MPEDVQDQARRERAQRAARAQCLSGAVKRCCGCPAAVAWRPVEEFSRGASRPDGLQRLCRGCARAYQQRYAARRAQLRRARRADRVVALPAPAAPRRATPRVSWVVECIHCGGYEEGAGPLLLPLFCWRDRSRLAARLVRVSRGAGPRWGLACAA